MRFGNREVPGELFNLARDRMLASTTFTPEEVRQHLLKSAITHLIQLSPLPANQWIIANRVMRACVKEMVQSGEIAQLKRGVWAKSSFLAAAK